MEVAEGAGDEALTATAILLFGPGGMELPGGYDTNEMSRYSKYLEVLRVTRKKNAYKYLHTSSVSYVCAVVGA